MFERIFEFRIKSDSPNQQSEGSFGMSLLVRPSHSPGGFPHSQWRRWNMAVEQVSRLLRCRHNVDQSSGGLKAFKLSGSAGTGRGGEIRHCC